MKDGVSMKRAVLEVPRGEIMTWSAEIGHAHVRPKGGTNETKGIQSTSGERFQKLGSEVNESDKNGNITISPRTVIGS